MKREAPVISAAVVNGVIVIYKGGKACGELRPKENKHSGSIPMARIVERINFPNVEYKDTEAGPVTVTKREPSPPSTRDNGEEKKN